MKQTKLLMGMPITVEVVDGLNQEQLIEKVFDYFHYIDQKFSTFKDDSEITLINRGKLKESQYSEDMKTVLKLSEQTKQETDGYFDICYDGKYDPSGLVKGWAILKAAKILKKANVQNYYIEAGGDIEVAGKNVQGKIWQVGIRNPFNTGEIVKVLGITDCGIATSGTYFRGLHIYDPKTSEKADDIVSLTVIGPNIYEADRFATAAFAMGKKGIVFIENLPGFEGYMIDKKGVATMTRGFEQYEIY